jgi:hypothetical protein
MSSSGYIYFWRKDGDDKGNIRVCKGSFPGTNVKFNFTDCDKPLQKTLRGINISRVRECPPPDGALLVDCDLKPDGGKMVATNVSEA